MHDNRRKQIASGRGRGVSPPIFNVYIWKKVEGAKGMRTCAYFLGGFAHDSVN